MLRAGGGGGITQPRHTAMAAPIAAHHLLGVLGVPDSIGDLTEHLVSTVERQDEA